jgi:SAM-dependent methyltransferase
MNLIRPASHPATNRKIFELVIQEGILDKKILDIGAGRGYMSQLLGEYVKKNGKIPADVISACDLFPEYFEYPEVICEKVAILDRLPYGDASFDLLYAIEVLEHLTNPYAFINELFRILKPQGKAIISVPNILNISSRISFLTHGFFDLFEPLSFNDEDAGRLCGHIMPLNFFYIEHGMRKAGFKKTGVEIDRLRKWNLCLYYLMFPFINLSAWRFKQRVIKKNSYLFEVNKEPLALMNGKDMLCSRSCIILGVKC